MSHLELNACQKALGLRKQSHKMSLGAKVHWLRSYTFPVLRDTGGLQTWQTACTHRALKESQGSERRSRQRTYRRYICRHNLCLRETQGEHGSCSVEGYRTCAHSHLVRIQCSLGPKSQTKQTLTVFKNQCLQAQSITIVCIHMAEGNHITGLWKLVLTRGQEICSEADSHLGPQARVTKCLHQHLLSDTKSVCMLGSERVYSICQAQQQVENGHTK